MKRSPSLFTNVLFALSLVAVCVAGWAGTAQAVTITDTYFLGESPDGGTRIQTGTGGLIPWIAKGTLPVGSILRSVSIDAVIEAADYDSWASDINAYLDPTPEAPGTAALLQVGGYGMIGTVTKMIGWSNGQNGPVTPVNDTKTAGDWSDLGNIDLNAVQLSIGNDYGPATWSGTISVTYDFVGLVWTGGTSEWSTNPVTNWIDITNTPAPYTDGQRVLFDNSVGAGSTTVDISVADVAPAIVLFDNNETNTYTLTGTNGITGATGLTKKGDGELIINNVNTYTGPTTVNKGTLTVNAGTIATLNVPAGTASLNAAASATMANVSGTGLLVINSAVGELNVSAGTASLNATATADTANVSGTGLLGLDGAVGTLSVTGGTANLNSSGTVGTLSVTGGTVNVGAGATITTATLSGGEVNPGTDSTIGTITTAGLTLESGSMLTFNITDSSTLDQISVTGTDGLTINGGKITIYDGETTDRLSAISGPYNLISYVGDLGGNVTNLSVANKAPGRKYTFGTAGNYVTLEIVQGTAWNGGSTAPVSTDWSDAANWSGVPPQNGDLWLPFATAGAGGAVLNNDLTDGSYGSLLFTSGAPAFTLNGNSITLTGDESGNIIQNNSANTQTVNMAIALGVDGVIDAAAGDIVVGVGGDISGDYSLTKTGGNQLTLSGDNSYTGLTDISAGTLKLGSAGALGGQGDVTVNGTLDLNGNSPTINAFNGSGTVTNGDTGEVILTVGYADASGTFAGAINDGAGSISLEKYGTGTLTLSGASNYTGGTTVTNGTLNLASGSSAGSGTITLATDTALGVSGASSMTIGNPIVVPSGTATIKQGAQTGTIIYGFSGGVTGGTSGTQTLSILLGAAGGNAERTTLLFSGSIQNGSGGTLGVNADFQSASSTGQGAFICLSGLNTFTGPIVVSNTADLRYNENPDYAYLGAWFVIGGYITSDFSDRTPHPGTGYLGGGNYTNTISLATGTILNYMSSANQTLGGVISGDGNIVKEGSGTLTLTNTNTYTGTTTVQNGTLGGTGSISGVVTVAAGRITGGGIGTTGTLTIGGGLTFNAGAISYFDIEDVAVKDYLDVTGALTAASGTIIMVSTDSLDPASYGIIGSSDITAAPIGNFTLQSLTGGSVPAEYSLGYVGNVLSLVVTGDAVSYWAPDAGGGQGSATDHWTATAQKWAANSGELGTLAQPTTGALVFTDNAGTVLVDDTVTAGAGLRFKVNGYTLNPGLGTPIINLTGATAAANTITTVGSGVTATISVDITAANGIHKAGTGTLILGGSLTSGGDVTIGAGTLQVNNSVSSGSAISVPTGTTLGVGASGNIARDVTVSGGNMNLAGTLAAGTTLTLNSGLVNVGTGGTVATATLKGGTVNAGTNALAITSTLQVPGLTATWTEDTSPTFLASGDNLRTARTLTLTGGTMTLVAAPAGPAEGSSLWLNANDTSKMTFGSGNAITAWASSSGTEGTVTGNGSYTPDVINGHAVVRFTNSEYMSNNVDLSSSACTIFAVERFYDGDNHNRIVSSSNNNWLLGAWGGELDRFYFEGWVTESGISADTNPHMYEATIGGSGQNSTVYVYDSRNLSSVQQLASNRKGTEGPNGLQLNGSGVWGELSNADVAEVLIYNGVLTAEQRAQTEAYLAYKYWGTVLEGGSVPGDFTTTSIGVTASSNLALPEGARLGKLTLSNNAVLTLSGGTTSASFTGLAGTGSVAGTVIIPAGGMVSPGTDSTIGSLSASGLTLDSGSFLTFEIENASSLDQVIVTGVDGLTINGGGIFLFEAGTTNKFSTTGVAYSLIGYSGGIGGDLDNLYVENKIPDMSYAFEANGSFITLTLAVAGYWNGGSGTDVNWSTTANWNGIDPVNGDVLVFRSQGGVGPALNNDLDNGRSFASLQFDSAAPGFTLDGNSIRLTGDGGQKIIMVNNSANVQTVNMDVELRANGKIDANSAAIAVGGNISGGFSLTKTGPGTLTISGANNTYNGGTVINGGAVVIDNTIGSTTLGAAGGNLTMGGGSLDLGTTSQAVGALSVTAAASSGDTISNGDITGASYNISNPDGDAVISASLLVNGSIGLTKSGEGMLTLTGTNTYTGLTNVAKGTLKLGSDGALPIGDVTVGGTLDLNGKSPTIKAFNGSGTGTVINGGTTASVLTVSSGTFSGAINDGDGTVALTVSGGTLTLSGNSSYSGGTKIASGTVNHDGLDAGGSNQALGSGTITMLPNTTLSLNRSVLSNAFNITDATIGTGNSFGSVVSGDIVVTGTATLMSANGQGNIDYTGNISGTGGVLSLGTRHLQSDAHCPVELFGTNNTFEGGVTLSGGGAVGIFSANGLGTGTLRTETTGGTLIVGADMSSGSGIANDIDLPIGNLTVTGSNSELSGQISGSGTLTKAGGNTLTLTNNSNSFGGLAVKEGSLTVSPGMVVSSANLSGGTTVDATHPLTVNTSANLAGLGVASDTPFILSGSNVANPTIENHRTITAQGGAMTISGTPIDLRTTDIAVTTDDTALSLSEPATLGNLTLKSGSLSASNDITMAADFIYRWELDSTAHSVAITGSLAFESTDWDLALVKVGDNNPAPGAKYDLFSYTGGVSGYSDPEIIALPAGWLKPSFTKDGTHICMMFGLVGDTNDDLVVDAADYIALKQNFGMTGAEWKDGDFDYDTDVDWDDLQLMMGNFGAGSLSAPATNTPEPATLGLLAIGALAMLRRRRRAA